MFGSGSLGMGVNFSVQNNASGPAAAAGQSISNLERTVSQATASIQNAAGKITSGIVAVTATVLALIGPFAATVESSGEFNFQISRAGAIARSSAADIELLREKAMDFGDDLQFNATQVAETNFVLSQAGYSVNQQIAMMPDLMNLATAGVVKLDYAAGVASDTMFQFGLQVDDMGRISDVIVNAANMSMVSVENFSQAMKYLGPTAKAFGIQLEEAAGYIEMMANSGMRGSIGTRAFGTSLVNLSHPTKEAAEIMQAIGFDAYDTMGKFVGLTEMTRRLQTSLQGYTDKDRDRALSTIFGNEAIQEMIQLMGLEVKVIENGTEVLYKGADALEYFTRKNLENKGVAKEVAEGVMNNYKSEVGLLAAAFETLRIKIGTVLEGPLRPMVLQLKELVKVAQDFIGTKFGQYLVLVSAGAAGLASAIIVLGFVFGILIPVTWSLVVALGALLIELSPFIAIGATVIGIVYVLVEAFSQFRAVMEGEIEPSNGFWGLLQKIAGTMFGLSEVWSSWDGKTFQLSEKTHDALQKMGLLDFVLTLATWTIRVKEFFNGVVEGMVFAYVIFESTWNYMTASITSVIDSLEEIGIPIRKLTADLEIFRVMGFAIGAMVSVIATPFMLLATVVGALANSIEFLIVNWQNLKNLAPALMGMLIPGGAGLMPLISQASGMEWKNTFGGEEGKMLPGVSESGNMDFAEIANRHREIMAMLGMNNNPTGVNGPPAPPQSTLTPVQLTVPVYIGPEQVAQQVIDITKLMNSRK